jgi:hypothetical protein
MVDRHYASNLKSWSARTLYVYAHADLAQKYSSAGNFCLQVVLPGRKFFFPALPVAMASFTTASLSYFELGKT